MDENIEIITNEIIENNVGDTVYNVAQNIYIMLSVLTFTIIIIFLYKILKNNFGFKK